MKILVNQILGHLRDANGSLILFLEAEVGGTVQGMCQCTLRPDVAAQVVSAIVENGVQALRDLREASAAAQAR